MSIISMKIIIVLLLTQCHQKAQIDGATDQLMGVTVDKLVASGDLYPNNLGIIQLWIINLIDIATRRVTGNLIIHEQD